MPFWAFYMIACGALVLLGWRVNAWKVPALILLGLIFMRPISMMPVVWEEIVSCTVWLGITALVYYQRTFLTAFLLGVSTLVYLPLLVVGFRIEYMGLLPIVSDLFLILAIGVSGGGIFGHYSRSYRNSGGWLPFMASHQSCVAESQARASETIGKG